MMTRICRLLIRGWDDPGDPGVRRRGGNVASLVGILINAVLFAGKFAVGMLSGSVSMQADAFNNLSDAGSSVISLVSFRLSSRPADDRHPFGHARYEYLASLAVAIIILLLGYELICSSVERIMSPAETVFSWLSVGVLVASLLFKLLLFLFYRQVGAHISSPVLTASAMDSVSDMLSTAAVLAGAIISPLTGLQLDGFIGLAVAAFIIFTALKLIRESLNDLLGAPASPALVSRITARVLRHPNVLGIHDLMVHDYGPGQCFASLHAEVSASEDILESHDMIDNIERELRTELGIDAVIHMDPVITDDARVNELRAYSAGVLQAIEPTLSMHDFRAVVGSTHTNCIFDVVVPHGCRLTDDDVRSQINARFAAERPGLFAVVNIDRVYVDMGRE